MLEVKDTPNHLGAYISGTFNDLEALYDAVYDVMGMEDEEESSDSRPMRVLGVLYDIRHAYMGNREIKLCPNGVTDTSMAFDGMDLPDKSVVFSVPVLWPALVDFAMITDDLAMEILQPRRFKQIYGNLPKEAYEDISSRIESSVGLVKFFASLIWRELKCVIGKNRAARIHRQDLYGSMLGFSINSAVMIRQYLDILNLRYIKTAPDKRPGILGKLVRLLLDPCSDRQYQPLVKQIKQAAAQYNVPEGELELSDIQYPEELKW